MILWNGRLSSLAHFNERKVCQIYQPHTSTYGDSHTQGPIIDPVRICRSCTVASFSTSVFGTHSPRLLQRLNAIRFMTDFLHWHISTRGKSVKFINPTPLRMAIHIPKVCRSCTVASFSTSVFGTHSPRLLQRLNAIMGPWDPGGTASSLGWTGPELRRHYSAGLRCGDNHDVLGTSWLSPQRNPAE
jgi:hypothetical protein